MTTKLERDKGSFTEFLRSLASLLGQHDLPSLAAGITFYAFFSLFPFLLLTIYVASMLVPPAQVEHILLTVLGPYFPDVQDAQDFIAEPVAKLASVGEKVGLFSAITLLWSAMSSFLAVQQAMDVIWGRPQRSFLGRRLVSFAMVMILLVVVLCTVIVMTVVPAVEDIPLLHAAPHPWLTWLQGGSRILFPLSLLVSFLICYRYIPSQRTPWTYVFPGAVTATVLLDIGRTLFVWYASHLVRYQVFYGGLAAVMLLLLWMYVGAMVLLFGAEVAATLERVDAHAAH